MILFSDNEVTVLRQLFARWELTNGRTAIEEIEHLDTAPYVVGFKPGPGEIRLERQEWDEFKAKLKTIAAPPVVDPAVMLNLAWKEFVERVCEEMKQPGSSPYVVRLCKAKDQYLWGIGFSNCYYYYPNDEGWYESYGGDEDRFFCKHGDEAAAASMILERQAMLFSNTQ